MSNLYHRPILFSINDDSPYKYNNRYVPRVTSILSDMLHEDYLMTWSNNIGLGRKKYKDVLEDAANVGTEVHDRIDHFFLTGKIIEDSKDTRINCAFGAFINWWKMIKYNNDISVIYNEKALICKLFGGTLDLLIKINDKYYLIDFKTSNNISYKHHLQLSAYRYMLKEQEGIEINGGCCILMLNKKYYGLFKEDIIDFSNPYNVNYMDSCLNTFLSLVNSYYDRSIFQKIYNDR